MHNLTLSEEALHYAARFLERWEEKSPNKEHEKMIKEFRAASNYLLDNLYKPTFITITRHK